MIQALQFSGSRTTGFVTRVAAVSVMLVALQVAAAENATAPAALETVTVSAARNGQTSAFDGVVEAVRQTIVAAQVAGAVTALNVKVGDTVRSGQLLARIDAQAAVQQTAASDAQVRAARASLELATKEYERQKQLFQKDYISQAALQRAQAQYQSAQAQVAALAAQASAARTQTGFFLVHAPYAGVISDMPVSLGDMAMPGRPLMTLYDPAALRVTVAVPQSIAAALASDAAVRIQLPGLGTAQEWIEPRRTQILPTSDAGTHTAQLRLELPPGVRDVRPGMFARAWLPTVAPQRARIEVPQRAVVRRAEMTGLYVVGQDGRPVLRQVRLGRVSGDNIEIMSGLSSGERVAINPQAAARVR